MFRSDAGYKCSEKAGNITAILVVNRVVTILSGGGLSINGKHVYCGDYIFSGHTVIFVMAYLCIKQCQYNPPVQLKFYGQNAVKTEPFKYELDPTKVLHFCLLLDYKSSILTRKLDCHTYSSDVDATVLLQTPRPAATHCTGCPC